MEQITLPWAKLLHPRSKYLYAAHLAGHVPLQDYLFADQFYLDKKEGKTVKILKDFLENKLTTGFDLSVMQNCWQIYSTINNRIFFESLLFNHPVEEVSEFSGVNKSTCEFYIKAFFNSPVNNTIGRYKFYECITSEDVLRWYQKCEHLSLEDLAYVIKGKQKAVKVEEGIVHMFQRAYNLFMTGTQSVLSPEVLRRGFTSAEKDLYDMAMRAASVASNLTRIYLQFESTINKDAKSFFSDWTFALKSEDEEQFKEPELPQDLKDQMNFLHQGNIDDINLDKKKGSD
jgi:hypothetical protein